MPPVRPRRSIRLLRGKLTKHGKETLMEKKKLALNKEVLRQLGDNELKQAAGGTFNVDWPLDNNWLFNQLTTTLDPTIDTQTCSCSSVTVTTTDTSPNS